MKNTMELFREVPTDMWVRGNYKGSYIFRKDPIPGKKHKKRKQWGRILK